MIATIPSPFLPPVPLSPEIRICIQIAMPKSEAAPCSYPSNTADPLSRGEASMVRMNSGRLGEISNVEVS